MIQYAQKYNKIIKITRSSSREVNSEFFELANI